MELCKIIVFAFTLMRLFSSFAFSAESVTPHQILYTMQAGHVSQAIELYQIYYKETSEHDLELIQRLGLILINQGWQSTDPEIQVLTIFGAGISTNEKTMPILEGGLKSRVPQIQLVALNLLSKYQNDDADEIINKALGSDNLLIRLEALNHLAEKKHPKALAQIEALMCKVDPLVLPLFPKLLAMVGDPASIKSLKKLLNHADQRVRLAAILSAAKYGRDDLLPQIRMLASHPENPQQEACAFALGVLRDEDSLPKLIKLANSVSLNVRLSALQALYRMGHREVKSHIEKIAANGNLFAIAALGEIQGSEPVLRELIKNNQLQIRINAGLALLQRQDPLCLIVLKEIFVHDSRDLSFNKISTIGGAMTAWKVVPCGRQNLQEDSLAYELSLNMKEEALGKALDLSEKDFLQIAQLLFDHQQNELIPTLVNLLENSQTSEAIALLKRYQQKAGAPLIRNYCNLALFSIGEEGPYADLLKDWVLKQQKMELIRFRPCLPWDARENEAKYELTPQETSRLLVDTFEAFAKKQNDKGVDVLLEAIAHGNAKNKYALAGLLIRATM
jgi:HEAT repeat protein